MISEETKSFIVMKEYGWTWAELEETPDWVVDYCFKKWKIEQEVEANNNKTPKQYGRR